MATATLDGWGHPLLVLAGMGLVAGLSVLQNKRVEAWEVRLRCVCVSLVSVVLLAALTWQLAANTVHRALYQGHSYFPASTPGHKLSLLELQRVDSAAHRRPTPHFARHQRSAYILRAVDSLAPVGHQGMDENVGL